MTSTIHIACNINSGYIRHCAIMLISLCKNNPGIDFQVHILSDDLSSNDIKVLSQAVCNYPVKFKFYIQPADFLENCPIDTEGHIDRSTYYRCFLSSLLPEDIDKILYLDCDIIVRGNIQELWDTDITDYAVACVQDMWSARQENYSRLQYDPAYSYFNAGVLLINMNYWRRHDIAGQSIGYITKYPERLELNDQDVLNALLHDKKRFVSFQWNMQDGFFRRRRRIEESTWPELDKAIQNPTVLHYTGGKKPWHYKSRHPYKKEYFKYLDMSPWSGWRPKTDYKALIMNNINIFLAWIRIKKNKYRTIKK